MSTHTLNPRQYKFVEGYLAGKPAKQAYRDAGYAVASGAAAEAAAARLLGNVKVQDLITEAYQAAACRVGVSAERVVDELARVAFADLRRLYAPDGSLLPVAEWDDETAAAVAVVETVEPAGTRGRARRVRRADKLKALELLGRHLKLFTDALDLTSGGAPVGTPTEDLRHVPDDDLRRRIAAIESRTRPAGSGETDGGDSGTGGPSGGGRPAPAG